MPNPKKPSEIIWEENAKALEKVESLFLPEDKKVIYALGEMCRVFTNILDDQHSQIQSLQKEVEELKKPRQSNCGELNGNYWCDKGHLHKSI